MHHRSIGARVFLALAMPLAASVGVGAGAGCNEVPVPPCALAVQVTFDRCSSFMYGDFPYGSGNLYHSPAGALQYCAETLEAAEILGCTDAHARFRTCLVDRQRCVEGVPRVLCDREEAALHACLRGQTSFELHCGNGRDDDKDGLADCRDPDCLRAQECRCPTGYNCYAIPQSDERGVDLLFVIDNSSSMASEQAMLQVQFPALVEELGSLSGGLPDLHLGVTSTDLGTSPFPITNCESIGGDQGRLLTGDCTAIETVPYIVDVAPLGCGISPDASGLCQGDTCDQASCAHEPSTTLVRDEVTHCPRCRNYGDQRLEDVFACIAGLGTEGCGFEQPLEAMVKALDPANTANEGFVRASAFLTILFVTDEDDCSAANPQLFDPSQTDIDSQLGPLSSFRCFELGIQCDQTGRTLLGPRTNCQPRDDSGSLLHWIRRYVNFLRQVKDPQMLIVAAIAGPVVNQQVAVDLDEHDHPEVQFSCSTAGGGAVPGIRLKSLIEAFNTEEDMAWAYTSICSPSFTDLLQGIGRKVGDLLQYGCPRHPYKGCPDPGAEVGFPRDSCAANDLCRPDCFVLEVLQVLQGLDSNTASEEARYVPPCLEVCASGPCPGNTDRSRAFAGGHPPLRDPSLPVDACWHIGYQESCPGSHFAELVLSRRSDPPPGSYVRVGCAQIDKNEQLCDDGLDNDEDCLVDLEDPDCQ